MEGKPVSHLKSHLVEVFAALRHQSMVMLAEEIITALLKENFSLDEFLQGIADYTDKIPAYEQATKHLELAAEELFKRRNEINGVSKNEQ